MCTLELVGNFSSDPDFLQRDGKCEPPRGVGEGVGETERARESKGLSLGKTARPGKREHLRSSERPRERKA